MGVVGRVCVCIGLGGALVLSFFVIGSPASAQSALLDALSTRVLHLRDDGSGEL